MAGHAVCRRTARQTHCADRVSEAKGREGDTGTNPAFLLRASFLDPHCSEARSHLINGQPARLVNLDVHHFDSGAESAAARKPRATPWVSESISAPCKGGGFLRPCRAGDVLGHVPGALPRAGMLRAVGASSWLSSRAEKTATGPFMRSLLVDRGQFGNIPAATQSFHQEDAGSHAAREEIYGGSLI